MQVTKNILNVTNQGTQLQLSFDATHDSQFIVNSAGVLQISPTGITTKIAASTTAGASLNIPLGTAPTTPNTADLWSQTSDNNIYWRANSTSYIIPKILTATATLDFPSTNAASSTTLTMTVTGAADGDCVALGIPNAAASVGDTVFSAWVSAANTVTVQCLNNNGLAAVNPASVTVRVIVFKMT
jgi:hypothetical protein